MKRFQQRNFGKTIHELEHKVLAKLITGGHLCYYSLVAVEAHGTYRYAAGFVGALVLVETVFGVVGNANPPAE